MDVPLGDGGCLGQGYVGRWACSSCCHLELSSSLWEPLRAPGRAVEVCPRSRATCGGGEEAAVLSQQLGKAGGGGVVSGLREDGFLVGGDE